MIVKCTCNKLLGFKAWLQPLKWFKVSHGLCNECLGEQLARVKGYIWKYLYYNAWKNN